jgi:hypothetical protein
MSESSIVQMISFPVIIKIDLNSQQAPSQKATFPPPRMMLLLVVETRRLAVFRKRKTVGTYHEAATTSHGNPTAYGGSKQNTLIRH